jgi:hypothetical protein
MPSGDEEEIAARDEVFLSFAAFFEACALLECPTCNPSLTQGAGRPECLGIREFDRERTSQIALIPDHAINSAELLKFLIPVKFCGAAVLAEKYPLLPEA